jgi:hypothetical protein
MPHEAGLLGAHYGQMRLEKETSANRGFFQNADIGHVYFSFLSNGVQSLSVFVERVGETRSRDDIWTDVFIGQQHTGYPAHINENIGVTVVGLETTRTLYVLGDLRLGGTLGLGFGLGGTSADVTRTGTDSTMHVTSAFDWQAFQVSFGLRLRYSVYITGSTDYAIIAGARYWGFPYLGPIAPSANYNGPDFRNANDLGYIAGIAIGF